MSKIPALAAKGANFNIIYEKKFSAAIELIKESIACQGATFPYLTPTLFFGTKIDTYLRRY